MDAVMRYQLTGADAERDYVRVDLILCTEPDKVLRASIYNKIYCF